MPIRHHRGFPVSLVITVQRHRAHAGAHLEVSVLPMTAAAPAPRDVRGGPQGDFRGGPQGDFRGGPPGDFRGDRGGDRGPGDFPGDRGGQWRNDDWHGRWHGAPWGDGTPPWGWGAPPSVDWWQPPPFGVNPAPFNYWGYNVQPQWDQGQNQWGFWLFGIWIPL